MTETMESLHRAQRFALSFLIISIVGCTNGLVRYDAIATHEAEQCHTPSTGKVVAPPPGRYVNRGLSIDYGRLAPFPDPRSADERYARHVTNEPNLLEQVYHDATTGNAQASYSICHLEVAARFIGREAARHVASLKCEYVLDCSVHFDRLPFSEETASGLRLLTIIGETFEAEAKRRRVANDLITLGLQARIGARTATQIRPAPPVGSKYPKDFPVKGKTKDWSAKFKTEREARAFAREKLGKKPVQVAPNKWRSADGKWQYRAKPGDVADRHIHLEELNPETGEVLQNVHLRWD